MTDKERSKGLGTMPWFHNCIVGLSMLSFTIRTWLVEGEKDFL